MNFKIKELSNNYFIVNILTDKQDITTSLFVISLINYLQIDANDFDNKLKTYNGLYLKKTYIAASYQLCNSNDIYRQACFRSKEDAKKFITEYLEPLLLIRYLS